MMAQKTRPNIVLVITDQQRFDTIAAQGHPHRVTRNLDRLVREGTSFTRVFVTAPSCAPSRASLFTGLYPHQTGVLRNEQPWRWIRVDALALYEGRDLPEPIFEPADIDAQAGDLLAALERRGVLDDSVVIFTSDHGDCLDDHGHSQKWTMYEGSVRVPAVVWGRGIGTRTVDHLCAWVDLGPTILDLAGLVPRLGGGGEGRPRVFAEHARDTILKGTACMSMVRARRGTLVHVVDGPEGQLFDLDADPREVLNLWDDPAHAEWRRELVEEILRWRTMTTMNPAPLPAPVR